MEINASYTFFTSKEFFLLILNYLIDPRPSLIAFGLRETPNIKYCIEKIKKISVQNQPFYRDRYNPISKTFFNDMELCKKFYFEFLRPRLDPFSLLETKMIEEKFSEVLPAVECPFYGPYHKDTGSLSKIPNSDFWSYFMCTRTVSFEERLVSKKELSLSELLALHQRRHDFMNEYERGKNYSTKQKLKEGWVWKVKK